MVQRAHSIGDGGRCVLCGRFPVVGDGGYCAFKPPAWCTSKVQDQLGKVSDYVIARQTGVSRGAVLRLRHKLGIPRLASRAPRASYRYLHSHEVRDFLSQCGAERLVVIVEKLGCNPATARRVLQRDMDAGLVGRRFEDRSYVYFLVRS